MDIQQHSDAICLAHTRKLEVAEDYWKHRHHLQSLKPKQTGWQAFIVWLKGVNFATPKEKSSEPRNTSNSG